MSLVVDGISFTYPGGTRPVLDEASLRLVVGQSCAVMAPSGEGKSTLLALVGGLLVPQKGAILLHGASQEPVNVQWIFQTPTVLPRRTAVDNVALPLLAAGRSRADAEAGARKALEAVGLGEVAGSLVRRLSGGQAQRVAVARAIASRPQVLLADEPTANLDYETGHAVMRYLLASMRDAIVLVATHDLRIAQMMDCVVMFDKGRLVLKELP